jgi:hypothetical protein
MRTSQRNEPHRAHADGVRSDSRRSLIRGLLSLPLLGLWTGPARALNSLSKTFQTPEAFLAEVFAGAPPPAQTLDLDSTKQGQVRSVFGRAYPQARLRYWKAGGRSAWIFDDIGKEGYVPTTAAFVVKDQAIESARVLIYRESRGEQVGEPSFLKQLAGARAAGGALDRKVDNISGATLSVKMMQRMARTALVFDSLVA